MFETLRRGTYSAPITHRGTAIWTTVTAPGARVSTGKSLRHNVTIPFVDVPQAVREGKEDVGRYRVFLQGTPTALRFFIKKNAGLTERPALAQFQPVTARGKQLDQILGALAVLNGQEPRRAPAKRSLLRADTLAKFRQLLVGELENNGTLRIFGAKCKAPGSTRESAKGAQWQWRYQRERQRLQSRRVGTSTWEAVENAEVVAALGKNLKELSAAGLLDDVPLEAGGGGGGQQAEGSGSSKGKQTANEDEEGAEEEPLPRTRKGKAIVLDWIPFYKASSSN